MIVESGIVESGIVESLSPLLISAATRDCQNPPRRLDDAERSERGETPVSPVSPVSLRDLLKPYRPSAIIR